MRVEQKAKVMEQFGASTDAYAKSEVHARGESLSLLVELLNPQKSWRALDIATGAGHAAMAIAPHVTQMIAADITRGMLVKTSDLAGARDIKNMDVIMADAESLPFEDSSFDLVTCRIALHHFSDARQAIHEFARVLKPNGMLGLDDNIVTEGGPIAKYYNAFEKVRDPSHNRVYTLSELLSMLEAEGLTVLTTRQLTKEIEFHEWADRQHVSDMDKEKLLNMMKSLPPQLQLMLKPRYVDGTVHFSLLEAVIIVIKSDNKQIP